MGFLCSNQQRITLSPRAVRVILNDCVLFHCLSRDGITPSYHKFINKIFCNYFDRADASIHMRLREKEEALEKLREPLSSEEIQKFSEKILLKEKERLTAKVNRLLSAECLENKVISLNNPTMQILETSAEDTFYQNRTSRYLRAVLEEYASADSLTRKKIYYRGILDEIKGYIEAQEVVEIRYHDSDNSFRLKPAFVRADKYENHLYLAGCLYAKQGSSPDGKIISCRIDRIRSMHRVCKSPVSPDTLATLENCSDRFGVQYLASKSSHIRIRLSEHGIDLYKRLSFQRPMYSGIEGDAKDVYVFDIPEYQAIVYFFKFGADAEVLEPVELRERFGQMYREAAGVYGGGPE